MCVWLVSGHQGSSCLYLPGGDFKCHRNAQIFMWVLESDSGPPTCETSILLAEPSLSPETTKVGCLPVLRTDTTYHSCRPGSHFLALFRVCEGQFGYVCFLTSNLKIHNLAGQSVVVLMSSFLLAPQMTRTHAH